MGADKKLLPFFVSSYPVPKAFFTVLLLKCTHLKNHWGNIF